MCPKGLWGDSSPFEIVFGEVVFVAFIHWVAVPFVVLLLMGLLVWGMRRDPCAKRLAMEAEIVSDDPAAAGRSTSGRTTILEHRRLLTAVWRDALPDLLVSFWKPPGSHTRLIIAHQQVFLPAHNRMERLLAALENNLFENAEEIGIPERSRFVKSYTFIRLIEQGQDLVIESRFIQTRFSHEFHFLDADGRMSPVSVHSDLTAAILAAARLVPYRSDGETLALAEQVAFATQHFERMLCVEGISGTAHGWLAHLGALGGAEPEVIRRHAALALEFSPSCQIARLEWRKLQGGEAVEKWISRVREFLVLNSDAPDQSGYLVAQSLLTLHQHSIAKILCEQLLLDSPGHDGASRLLQTIARKERGAET